MNKTLVVPTSLLGVTQKTAWFMLHRVRLAMQSTSYARFSGEVEVDETFIGGAARFMHKARKARVIRGTGGMDKSPVMGLLERHGPGKHSRVKAIHVRGIRRAELHGHVRANVARGSKL